MVDSTPAVQGPPSSTGTRPSNPATTCAAVVGDSRPERLAEGAASGRPAARISSSASGWSGMRMPTVSSPAVTISLRPAPGLRRSTSVSGPGQNCGEPPGEGAELDQFLGHFEVGHVDDQRVEARPALGLVDLEHGVGIGGVGAEPVDRLGGEGDDPACPQETREMNDS